MAFYGTEWFFWPFHFSFLSIGNYGIMEGKEAKEREGKGREGRRRRSKGGGTCRLQTKRADSPLSAS